MQTQMVDVPAPGELVRCKRPLFAAFSLPTARLPHIDGNGIVPVMVVTERMQCRCVWAGIRCLSMATQEDGLCDWCSVRRPEDLEQNPNLLRDPGTGEVLGLGGGGEVHVDPSRTPDACWMPGSERTLAL